MLWCCHWNTFLPWGFHCNLHHWMKILVIYELYNRVLITRLPHMYRFNIYLFSLLLFSVLIMNSRMSLEVSFHPSQPPGAPSRVNINHCVSYKHQSDTNWPSGPTKPESKVQCLLKAHKPPGATGALELNPLNIAFSNHSDVYNKFQSILNPWYLLCVSRC